VNDSTYVSACNPNTLRDVGPIRNSEYYFDSSQKISNKASPEKNHIKVSQAMKRTGSASNLIRRNLNSSCEDFNKSQSKIVLKRKVRRNASMEDRSEDELKAKKFVNFLSHLNNCSSLSKAKAIGKGGKRKK
jgi:hypothetical protein